MNRSSLSNFRAFTPCANILALAGLFPLAGLFHSQAQSPSPSPSAVSGKNTQSGIAPNQAEDYASWIAVYAQNDSPAAHTRGSQLELAITTISGDDMVPEPKKAAVLGPSYPGERTTWTVTRDGKASMYRSTAGALQGGGLAKLPDDTFRQLHALTTTLPDDGAYLPPRGRRVVVQTTHSNRRVAHVYDKANLPDSVLAMLRLLGADAWPVFPFPDFEPDRRWPGRKDAETAHELDVLGFSRSDQRELAISPDGKLKVVETNPSQYFDATVHVAKLKQAEEAPYSASETVLQIQDTTNRTVIHEVHQPMNGRSYVYLYAGRFTPDGKHLLVLSSVPDLRVYDTSTWRQESRMHGIPAEAAAFYPSTDWKHAVVVLPSGEIDLVETDTDRQLARVDFGNELQNVTFSPDGFTVAIVTTGHDAHGAYEAHLRLWEAATGKELLELRPLEGTPHGFGEPVWWPDGKYLMAPFGMNRVGIWNARTGRYRGALTGCAGTDAPWTRFLLEGTRFYKMCGDYELMTWDADAAIRQIAAFETSLPQYDKAK